MHRLKLVPTLWKDTHQVLSWPSGKGKRQVNKGSKSIHAASKVWNVELQAYATLSVCCLTLLRKPLKEPILCNVQPRTSRDFQNDITDIQKVSKLVTQT